MHRTVDRSLRKSKYWKYTRYPYCFSYLTVLTLLSQAIDNSSISSQVWHNGIMLGQQSLQECNVPSVMFRSAHITYVQVHQNKYKGNKHVCIALLLTCALSSSLPWSSLVTNGSFSFNQDSASATSARYWWAWRESSRWPLRTAALS